MSIFDSLGNGNMQNGQQITPQQALSQLQSDPSGVLKQIGLNVPAGMTNPQQMVQHLMQTGQIPQSRFSQAMQMMGQMMGRR